jgi:CRP-like cAMP-binding protein
MGRVMHLATSDLDVFMARKRNASVFREGDTVGSIYQVESGCVRIVKLCGCGQRCILRFCFPGDLFGLGSQGPDEIDAEAASDTKISKMTASRLATIMQDQPQRALAIIDAAYGGQGSQSEHFVVVSYGHADAKIAWFLNCLASRAIQAGGARSGGRLVVDLPMPRRDIADHLGMKLETLSREMAKLREANMIETIGFRKIVILKPVALAQRAALDAHEIRKSVGRNNAADWMPALTKDLHHLPASSGHGQVGAMERSIA